MTTYHGDAYDMSDYPNFREYGGTRECDGRLWGFVAVDNAPPTLQGRLAQALAEYAATLGDQDTRLNTTSADMLLMWSVRGSGPIVSQAQVSRYEGEAAGGVQWIRWGGSR